MDSARRLLDLGHDPSAKLVMRHAGSDVDSLRATVDAAAKLTVKEDDSVPRFRRWKPSPYVPVKPPVSEFLRATPIAA